MDCTDFCAARLWRPRISTALITGFMAKESVVSTDGAVRLLHGAYNAADAAFRRKPACVLPAAVTPCVAAIASVKRELGGKWAAGVVIGQCGHRG